MKNRPGHPRPILVTPSDATSLTLLGGQRKGNVALTHDQMHALRRMYGFVDVGPEVETARQLHEENERKRKAEFDKKKAENHWSVRDETFQPRVFDEEGVRAFQQAGADRNLLRHAEVDGLRMVAFIANFIEEAGGDPVRLLVELCSEAGFDTSLEAEGFEDDEEE